jgi:hypothetical protein
VQADISRGNAWIFLPTDTVCRLVAETGYGHLGNDFDNPAIARSVFAAAAKINLPVRGGGQTAIKLRTVNGDVRIVKTNP